MDDGRDGASGTLMPATPPRFSIDRTPDAAGLVRIAGPELHHMRTVLRLPIDARVSLLDPLGGEHQGKVERYERHSAVIRIQSSAAPPARPRIILAAAIVKGPRMDFLVEKAAELGASDLWPIVCARGLVRSPGAERLARWRRLALAAAKQSLSPAPMEVRAPVAIDDVIREAPRDALAVICTQGGAPLTALIRRLRPRGILIAIGPEGDFDDDERAKTSTAGFVAASLGPNRLRSETAALGAVSIAQGLLHDGQEPGEDAETEEKEGL